MSAKKQPAPSPAPVPSSLQASTEAFAAGSHVPAVVRDAVDAVLDAAGFDCMPSRQIVLTGGGSQIPGLETLAARILGQNVRIGRPLRIQGLAQNMTTPGHAATVGLALFAAHPQDEWWDFDMPVSSHGARSVRRVARWFRNHW